jgi:4-hydroxyphenylpyruvate dioxygenase
MSNQDNPCKLNGFAFLEFSGPDKEALVQQFTQMGFHPTAHHTTQDLQLLCQNDIQFIINATPDSQAAQHAKVHGAGACAMGFKVKNAKAAFEYVMAQGATAFTDGPYSLLGIEAIGGSVIYFVEEATSPFGKLWQTNTKIIEEKVGLLYIDHLTHNVFRGHMDLWADFYRNLFNFHQIRYFDIEGKMTGLISRALASPCGRIKIPLNESKDEKSQIEEFLHEYHGEGIQHIALSTGNIYQTVHALRTRGLRFLDVPDTYYELLSQRLPWHQEPLMQLQQEKILMDGEVNPEQGLLLQIFTENLFGPVFFEIIQRKGNEGFGEGNFQALFEAIERDQFRRGSLS